MIIADVYDDDDDEDDVDGEIEDAIGSKTCASEIKLMVHLLIHNCSFHHQFQLHPCPVISTIWDAPPFFFQSVVTSCLMHLMTDIIGA
jgi:hypothetical protein